MGAMLCVLPASCASPYSSTHAWHSWQRNTAKGGFTTFNNSTLAVPLLVTLSCQVFTCVAVHHGPNMLLLLLMAA